MTPIRTGVTGGYSPLRDRSWVEEPSGSYLQIDSPSKVPVGRGTALKANVSGNVNELTMRQIAVGATQEGDVVDVGPGPSGPSRRRP